MNDTTPTPPEEAVDDTAVEVPSAESSGSERKRPALKPTGGDSARAIPSRTKPVTTPSEGEPSIEEKLADVAAAAAAETETTDSPPVAQKEA
ncbi:MAG: hypothetical protein VX669_15805, partial [Planctomycetota bacterium]|nr:hypothetical protein [Planctomycetota bacterium]